MNPLEPLVDALHEVATHLKALSNQLEDLLTKVEEEALERDEADEDPY